MKELLQELKQNQKIKGTETVRIDYIIERLTEEKERINNYLNERLDFLNGAINHFIEDDEETALKYMYCRSEVESIKKLIEGGQDENNN